MLVKKTVVFDFDGVIHSYTSGWKGETCIPDPPVPNIEKVLEQLQEEGYQIVIVSSRCATMRGRAAIEDWLDKYSLTMYIDKISKEKPPAICYIDDRAICFDGDTSTLVEKIHNFKPWYHE